VKLAQHSNRILMSLQQRVGRQLYFPTGGLIVGPSTPGSEGYHGSTQGFVQQSLRCADEFSIPHKRFSFAELRKQFPQYHFQGGELGYYEEKMGYIKPEACVQANVQVAKAHGATISTQEEMQHFEKRPDGKIYVKTSKGSYVTDKLILAAGPWIGKLIPEHAHHFAVYRQTVFWFEVAEKARHLYQSDRFKPFIWDRGLNKSLYGFPIMPDAPHPLRHAVKIGKDCFDSPVDPDTMQRTVSQQEIDTMYKELIAPNFAGVMSTCVQAKTCTYTTTKDFKFIVDYLPGFGDSVVVVSACSGHGAKHAAAVGEAVAEKVILGCDHLNVFEMFGGKLLALRPVLAYK
jgi:sarcosine oxidase